MTDIKIDTASGLESFLKILAEESVASSRRHLLESDSGDSAYQEKITAKIKSDKGRFDEAEEDDEFEDEPTPSAGSDQGETDQDDPQPQAEPEESESSKEEINYYSIRNIINQIRAGDSTRDSEVAEPLEQYIMSDLSDEERELMYTFFLSVANIMNKTGQAPQDPSDPPTSISVSRDSKKSSPDDSSSQKASSQNSDRQSPASSRSPGEEDTRPPIQVGSQMKEALRQKVLDLMRA